MSRFDPSNPGDLGNNGSGDVSGEAFFGPNRQSGTTPLGNNTQSDLFPVANPFQSSAPLNPLSIPSTPSPRPYTPARPTRAPKRPLKPNQVGKPKRMKRPERNYAKLLGEKSECCSKCGGSGFSHSNKSIPHRAGIARRCEACQDCNECATNSTPLKPATMPKKDPSNHDNSKSDDVNGMMFF